mgnify:CR=1 FL=1
MRLGTVLFEGRERVVAALPDDRLLELLVPSHSLTSTHCGKRIRTLSFPTRKWYALCRFPDELHRFQPCFPTHNYAFRRTVRMSPRCFLFRYEL